MTQERQPRALSRWTSSMTCATSVGLSPAITSSSRMSSRLERERARDFEAAPLAQRQLAGRASARASSPTRSSTSAAAA